MRLIVILVLFAGTAHAAEPDNYPYPVQTFEFESQRQDLEMAYMDARPPEGDVRGVFVLLHGKNFNGAYWHQTIDFLTERGYRVVVPDQIGFGRSSLPEYYQFTFAQLAANTRVLLNRLGIDSAAVLGHSMGGMLAARFALQYPAFTEQLVMLNPIGLEDWRAKGVPYVPIEQIYQGQRGNDYESIKSYQQASYYDGRWSERFEPWARMLADLYESDRGDRFAWNMALTADMILSQPVVHEFDRLEPPTTLLIGLRDRTAIGRNLVDEELAQSLGDYPSLGKAAAERIPGAGLIEFEGVGHLPHIEAPDQYLEALDRTIK